MVFYKFSYLPSRIYSFISPIFPTFVIRKLKTENESDYEFKNSTRMEGS